MSYSKKHYTLLSNGAPDTEEAAQARIRYRRAGEQAHAETMERFAPLTPLNLEEALAWQKTRIMELETQFTWEDNEAQR